MFLCGVEEHSKHIVAVPMYPNPDPSRDVRDLLFVHRTCVRRVSSFVRSDLADGH
jgi:hypothetical protein